MQNKSPLADIATVRHVAHLARLKISDEEAAHYQQRLAAILDAFGTLNQFDTTGVEPTAHPLAVQNVLREDVPAQSLGVERVLMNAPRVEAGCFALPKVLDQESA